MNFLKTFKRYKLKLHFKRFSQFSKLFYCPNVKYININVDEGTMEGQYHVFQILIGQDYIQFYNRSLYLH